MTDTLTASWTRPDGPVSGHRRGTGRLLRSIAYDARLLLLGMGTMADAVTGEERTAASRREQLTRSRRLQPTEPEGDGSGRVGPAEIGRAHV